MKLRSQLIVSFLGCGLVPLAALGVVSISTANRGMTAMEQDAFIAIDIGQLGFAAGSRCEAWIKSEAIGLRVKLADIDYVRSNRS